MRSWCAASPFMRSTLARAVMAAIMAMRMVRRPRRLEAIDADLADPDPPRDPARCGGHGADDGCGICRRPFGARLHLARNPQLVCRDGGGSGPLGRRRRPCL